MKDELPNSQDVSSTEELGAGAVIKNGDEEYQLVEDENLGTVATEIGDRILSAEQVPDVGDDCIRPQCDGHVEDVNGRLWCSEGCLEWFRTTPKEGDLCDEYGDRCDGEYREIGELKWECDECGRVRSSERVTWREAWLPSAYKEEE